MGLEQPSIVRFENSLFGVEQLGFQTCWKLIKGQLLNVTDVSPCAIQPHHPRNRQVWLIYVSIYQTVSILFQSLLQFFSYVQ